MRLFAFTTDVADGVVRLALTGELDSASADRFAHELGEIQEGKPPLLVLDLRELKFLDSTGLGVIVHANDRAEKAGGRLVIVEGPETVRRIFEITGLTDRIEIVADPSAIADAG